MTVPSDDIRAHILVEKMGGIATITIFKSTRENNKVNKKLTFLSQMMTQLNEFFYKMSQPDAITAFKIKVVRDIWN